MSKNPLPTRMCSGCMARLPKKQITRIVASDCGKAIIDTRQILPGRGVYICLNESCIEKAEKKNRFSKGLKCDIDKSIYTELKILANKR